ncbi:hypothetical protein MPER_00832, partial [Moniliophthora perniciosa FA553]
SKGLSSFVSVYLDEKKGMPTLEEEELVKAAAASLYSGTSHNLGGFVMLISYQGGAETSPSAINWVLDALPYITAVMLELLKMTNIKGTTSKKALWCGRTYDPFEFKPERYLDESGKLRTGKGGPTEAVGIAFGIRRR